MESASHGERETMRYGVRPMTAADVPQVLEIERDAFPEIWPPTPFDRELRNRLARHLVAYDIESTGEWDDDDGKTADAPPRWVQALPLVRRFLPRSVTPSGTDHVVGYVGVWFMLDEAHITAIASRSSHRGQGVGEVLLIASVELALAQGAKMVTLEARVSNTVAHNLYRKYGLAIVGRRKSYYSDNNEDAYVMSTEDITAPQYKERFDQLRREHSRRWGVSARYIT